MPQVHAVPAFTLQIVELLVPSKYFRSPNGMQNGSPEGQQGQLLRLLPDAPPELVLVAIHVGLQLLAQDFCQQRLPLLLTQHRQTDNSEH